MTEHEREQTGSMRGDASDEPGASQPSEAPRETAVEHGRADEGRGTSAKVRRLFGAWGKRAGVVLLVVLAFLAGMQLASPEAADGHTGHSEATTEASTWTCSMHPQIQMSEPGQCPICGMDLIPVTAGGDDEGNEAQVSLSERAKELAEVRTTTVRRAETAVEVKLLGRLEYDETRERSVTPWTAGRIERLFVASVGARVGWGQVIAHLYSPEVYAAHQDLITAKRQLTALGSSILTARGAGEAALQAARNRLLLLGVTKADLEKMEKSDEPWRYVKIRSNYGGTVLELLVNQGSYVNAGTPMFRLADLSELWVQLDAYENDLAQIDVGQQVALRVESFPGEIFEGKVSFIDPVVDPRMRTARVRVEVPNKDGRLRPGMFAEAVLDAEEAKPGSLPLVVPKTAPLFTGERSLVYVKVPGKDKPTYEAREVRLGPRAGDLYPVVSGLAEGEEVVMHGAFRLDSDLQIRGGPSMMTMADDVARTALAPIGVPSAFMRGLAPVVETYLELQVALSRDELEEAREDLGELAKRASSFQPRTPEKAREAWKDLSNTISQEALAGKKAEDIEAARRRFERISTQLIVTVQRFGNPLADTVRLAYCPMASGSKGAFWLQRADGIENPYFGASMFACGEIRASVEQGKRLSPHAAAKDAKPGAAGGHDH